MIRFHIERSECETNTATHTQTEGKRYMEEMGMRPTQVSDSQANET